MYDSVDEDEIGGACSTKVEKRKGTCYWKENHRKRDY
jgi:hypothetical protein